LAEGREKPEPRLFIHADAIVGHLKLDLDLLWSLFRQQGAERHPALPLLPAREFNGVIGKVDQHLAEAKRVTQDFRGNLRIGE
jgi:hypothetical protein